MVNNSTLLAFVYSNWIDFLVIGIMCIAVLQVGKLLVKYDKHGKVRGILITLCVEAEKYLGTGTGQLKKQEVIAWFRLRHPVISMFISTELLDKLIDDTVDGINNYLSDNGVTLDGLETNINLTGVEVTEL